MVVMHAVAVSLIFLSLPIKISISLNIYNNACGNYSDYPVRFWSKHCYHNPSVLSDTPTIIRNNGYGYEAYTLTTLDGYILTIFRIPPTTDRRNSQPVFLMHGIIMNPEIWVFIGNRSLAFNLADEGYDVWLGTFRGTNFARTHKTYNMSSAEYWNFNLDSIAYFDISAQLKFIANKTEKGGSIIYLGHSMGSTLSFMYASGFPQEASSLLSGIIALAPVVYFRDLSVIDTLLTIAPELEKTAATLKIGGVFHQKSFNQVLVNICGGFPQACRSIVQFFAGTLTEQFRPDELLLFFSYCPSPTGIQVLKHYKQLAKSRVFKAYDYGSFNANIYNSSSPRRYYLQNIEMPVYLFYGKNDALVSEKSVEMLFRELGSVRKTLQHIPKYSSEAPFNHLDFFMARDIRQYLYTELFQVLNEINKVK